MKLSHYHRLYKADATKLMMLLEKEELIKELLSRYTIADWKLWEKINLDADDHQKGGE